MLMSIPIISPIEVRLSGARQLPSAAGSNPNDAIVDAEYTVHPPDPELPPQRPVRPPGPPPDLDGPVKSVMYQDSNWWSDRVAAAKRRLRGEDDVHGG